MMFSEAGSVSILRQRST